MGPLQKAIFTLEKHGCCRCPASGALFDPLFARGTGSLTWRVPNQARTPKNKCGFVSLDTKRGFTPLWCKYRSYLSVMCTQNLGFGYAFLWPSDARPGHHPSGWPGKIFVRGMDARAAGHLQRYIPAHSAAEAAARFRCGGIEIGSFELSPIRISVSCLMFDF